MVNELKTICDLLDGYTDDRRFDVIAATKTADGKWDLTIEHRKPQNNQEAEDANK